MPKEGSNFISAEKLHEHLEADRAWNIIDVRFDMGQTGWGIDSYKNDHLPGAVYMALEYDFSVPASEHEGRHPMPSVDRFITTLNDKGIDLSLPTVIYDLDYPTYAARLWWMLRFLVGKDDVYILDGGYKAWEEMNLPLIKGENKIQPIQNESIHQKESVHCDHKELLDKISKRENVALIDARAPERFFGQEEPIDPIAGHIPTAINFYWQSAYGADGKILPVDELLPCLSDLAHYENIIAYCGSGVTACAIILAMDESGIPDIRLYCGSWSEWINYDEYPKVLADS